MSLINWAWLFLLMYIGIMCCIGFYAQRKIKSADDFATARGSYGPFFLAFPGSPESVNVQKYGSSQKMISNEEIA